MINKPSRPDPGSLGRAHPRLPKRLGWFVLVVLVAGGFGVIASRSSAPPEREPTGPAAEAAATIEAMLDPAAGDPLDRLPADFTAVTGVTPGYAVAPDGQVRAVHVGGGCSTPWGDDNTRWDYTVGCQAHDLGYDLLRYAEAKGLALGADPRRRLDDRLSADMHAQCDLDPRGSAGTCEVVATLFSAGLVVNSWHQRWGPPRTEPIGAWTAGLLVVIALLVVRVPILRRTRAVPPARKRAPLAEPDRDQAAYLAFLRMASLVGVVVAESVLAIAPMLGTPAAKLWPLTWLLQLAPLFFFAGGHANLLAWRRAVADGTGYGGYLAGRVCWLIRPVLAFLTAWLVLPLSLDLLRVPADAVGTVGRLVVGPLWLLCLYLLVVSLTPAMVWLHRKARVVTPLAMAAAVVGLEAAGSAIAASAVLAVLFGQLASHYADRARVNRGVLAGAAVLAVGGLVVLTTAGGRSPLLIADPGVMSSATAVLLIGLAHVCLAALPGPVGVRAVALGGPARAARFVRSAPMTMYLVLLCAVLMLAGIIGAARSAGLPTSAVDWLAQPRSLLALALLGVPTALVFVLFEWRATLDPDGTPDRDRGTARRDALAAALGTGYGAAGILGFAVTGLTGTHQTPVLLGFPLEPMASIIHLLLGWYLLHSVRIGTTSTPWPWLMAAVACVPPVITSAGTTGAVVHITTTVVTLGVAAGRVAALPRRSAVRGDQLAGAEAVP
ncbi:phospholipase [Actinokineospora sp. HUAS TT18]|uniref:phospholipase n=1 Tax=Actinokineospora sp. HUAS TT18 TaxID=3447451 RepID=UPI003F5289EA